MDQGSGIILPIPRVTEQFADDIVDAQSFWVISK
jgi:hypothetical protein